MKEDAELAKDISAFFAFTAVVAASTPLSLVAALGVVLQTSGSMVSAALNLIGRFRGEDGLPADSLKPYDRFHALFLITTVRAYMEALDGILQHEIDEIKGNSDQAPNDPQEPDEAERSLALKEAQARARAVEDADLTYLFGVEPLTDEVPLLLALRDWLVSSLALLGLSAIDARRLADKCDKAARSGFHALISQDNPESTWMRNFLALESQAAQKASLDALGATTTALQGWVIDHETPVSSRDAWNEYRETLIQLPNHAETMYSESFGVSAVFQAPMVKYHVAGIRGEAGAPHDLRDVGSLLGALVSTRTEGQDLIILSGGPGSGKSTLCRVFASELAKSTETYPIFLRLRRVKEGAEITQFIEEALQGRGLIDRIAELQQLPNVVLILDGFDELVAANRSRLRQFFNALLDEKQTGPLRNAHVIVSGRDTLFPGGQGLPAGSHVVSLQPFDRARVEAWGGRWRDQHASGPGSSFHPELFLSDGDGGRRRKDGSALEQLLTWPLTLHLVARVHTAGGLPEPDGDGVAHVDKAYLYRSILAETSERQAGQVSGTGRLEPEAMHDFLRAVAWLMYTRSVDSLEIADVAPLLELLREKHRDLDPNLLAEIAVVNAPELAKGEETGFEFVHKSFSEFLAAESIAEHVEKASFKVLEFGSQVPAWRMSENEASSALAGILGIRLLPAEIQEMLEPMLGAVLQFREGKGVEERVPPDVRRAGLESVLERTEELYEAGVSASTGLSVVESAVEDAPGVNGALEVFGNYLVGLALVGCAAANQLSLDGSSGRKFKAEPEPGAIWRFLSLAHAGNIGIDEPLANRLFARMTVKIGDTDVTDTSIPWRLHLLEGMEGYRPLVARNLARAVDAHQVTTRLLILLAFILVQRAQSEDARMRDMPPSHRFGGVWDRMRFDLSREDPVSELAMTLDQQGAVGPQFTHEISRRPGAEEHDWAELIQRMESGEFNLGHPASELTMLLEQFLRRAPRRGADTRLFRMLEEIVVDWRHWSR
ncbi:MAG: NACHT domain-containing protein [Solirubrobacterales bacterium]